MKPRELRQLVPSTRVSDGAGVTIHRSIGTPALRQLDPFLMLDQFGSDDPDDYIAGFPDHPHRGFITVTYMLDGHMQHQDSMGNRGDLRPGSVQWMKAASGVIHSEMPQQEHGMMRGFQLWLNLPASEKMSDPAYQEFSADKIPLFEENGKRVKVISGEYQGVHGPVNDPHTGVVYLDVELAPGTVFQQQVNPQANAFIYVFEGSASIAGKTAPTHSLLVLGPGDGVEIATADERARFILVAGNPLNEPVVYYGPFVMNSREEIMQAVDDFNRGKLVRTKAAMTV
jgi:redox-sensitive bicupin YhaK (pirin superfamily)